MGDIGYQFPGDVAAQLEGAYAQLMRNVPGISAMPVPWIDIVNDMGSEIAVDDTIKDQDLLRRCRDAVAIVDEQLIDWTSKYFDNVVIMVDRQPQGDYGGSRWPEDSWIATTLPVQSIQVLALTDARKPTPGVDNATYWGLAAALRHEYGHGIMRHMPASIRRDWALLVPEADRLEDELTRHAANCKRVAGDPEAHDGENAEAFAEMFAAATDPLFNPDDWQPWFNEAWMTVTRALN